MLQEILSRTKGEVMRKNDTTASQETRGIWRAKALASFAISVLMTGLCVEMVLDSTVEAQIEDSGEASSIISTPISTKTPTPNQTPPPTPTPSATSTPANCMLINFNAYDGSDGVNITTVKGQMPDCFASMVYYQTDRWTDDYVTAQLWRYLYFIDDPNFPRANGYLSPEAGAYIGNVYSRLGKTFGGMIESCMTISNPHNGDLSFGGGKDETQPGCGSGRFYITPTCRLVNPTNVASVCGSTINNQIKYTWQTSTPISLIWEKGTSIDEAIAFVRFGLNPLEHNQTWLWKASKKTPLLVYDPAHEGHIQSASQLFGNWTFGGQRVASLGAPESPAVPWKNGYDALALLDLDGDEKISGVELAPIGVWFDENQNAISEEGEVVSAVDAGLVSLFYKDTRENTSRHETVALVGYERTENGQRVFGPSVDWSSEGTVSGMDMVARHLYPKLDLTMGQPQPLPSQSEDSESHASRHTTDSSFDGLWAWHVDADPKAPQGNSGFFVFKEDSKNSFRGQNIFVLPMKVGDETMSAVEFRFFTGSKSSAENRSYISFEVTTPDGKVIKNSAEIRDNILLGKSVLNVEESGKRKTISYSWKAQKVAAYRQ